ncbi:Brp/Blh family beta-carotene 15,15'-dioxygenase [Roseovarius tibetensis]|uniref:Brp/Blh family beta-carotene 15,15'-dioxygenase n=1 Tax=Roseovarius tibetensis TaxID=2685897 RepID=UPI003D7F3CFD
MTTNPAWQTVLFGCCAGLAVVWYMFAQPGLVAQLLLLAPLVAILGLPHGALDLPIAEALWPLHGWRGKLRFMAVYLGLASVVIVLWTLVPGIALAAFLAYSVLHFSDDWSYAASPLRWTGGVATIGAPALVHPEEVAMLFAYLAPPAAAGVIAHAAAMAGALGLFLFAATCLFRPEARGRAATEQAILWGLAALLPPLMFFTIYFCGLHSIRHFSTTILFVPRAKRALAIAALLSGIVTLAAAGYLHDRTVEAPDGLARHLVQTVFIGLAALTVPHMILVEGFRNLKKRRSAALQPNIH